VAVVALAGCLTGGSDDDAEPEGQSLNVSTSPSSNASGNATYLQASDYNQTHVHDYWPGRAERKVLISRNVETNRLSSASWTTFSVYTGEPDPSVGWVCFSLPNGSFVPEGTGQLSVEVDATGALENGQQVLRYDPANADRWHEIEAQGATANWTIDVTPEMTDLPHAKSTRWACELEAEGPGAVLDGSVNVTIVAEKTRDFETWPEHQDSWDRGNEIRIELSPVNETFDKLEQELAPAATGSENRRFTLAEGEIVPPETEVLLVDFRYERSDDAKNEANADVWLLVKLGSSSRWLTHAEDRIVEQRDGFKRYAIPVDGATWDSPYANESSWRFRIHAPSGVRGQTDKPVYNHLAGAGQGEVPVDARAFREVPDWLEEPSDE